MNWPGEPSGSSSLAAFLKRLLQAARASEIRPGIGYRVKRSTTGTVLELGPIAAAPVSINRYKFSEMGEDGKTIIANTWNGDEEGNAATIALPPELWNYEFTETIRGDSITYSNIDIDNQTRTATRASDSASETQYITRPYIDGDIIWAATGQSEVEGVTLYDLNRGARAWMGLNSA